MARCFTGQRLRDARLAAGYSPERLAVAAERSAFSVLSYEAGRIVPPVNVLARIADELGIRVDDLLGEEVTADAVA